MEQLEFALVLAFHIALLLSGNQVSSFSCKAHERKALLTFKQSFINSSNHFVTWVGENCCDWEGLGCDNSTGHVVALDLRCSTKHRLSSSCAELEASKLDPSLVQLKHLRYLDLSGNNFNGIQIPHFIGSMKQLQYLNLSLAKFGGEVPCRLGNLTKLRSLDLFSSGDFPMEANNLKWTYGLQSLEYLDMSAIDLSLALDSIEVIHKIPSLLYLRLSSCQLGNTHLNKPLINSTSILQHLDLSDNLFSESIPQVLANLSSLRVLDLSFNFFSSSIPSWLQTKITLQNLNLAGNNLANVEGGILGLLGRLCHLKSFDVSLNHLEDHISFPHGNFSRCNIYELESIYMNVNNFSGDLYTWLGNFRHLRYLDLGSNSFSNSIPVSLENISSLQHLDLSNNHFNGNIPKSLGNLSSLERIDLSNNNLDGIVSEANFAKLSRLTYLDLSSNSLSLEMNSNWLPPFQLQILFVRSLKLNTSFPQWLQAQKKLLWLDVSDVGMFGSLPENMSVLFPSLITLRMANNLINGSVPHSLCKLRNLELLDLRNNKLTRPIPDCWKESQALEVLDLSSNELSGPLPTSLPSVAALQALSLSNNKLLGDLSFFLCNLTNLVILDVGENNISGKIPPWNEECFAMLEILRMRANRLHGKLPPQLCLLQKLHIIDLASNSLSGSIPECFGNFSAMTSLAIIPGPVNVGPFPSEGSVIEVTKGEELEYTTNLGLFANMDLSSNNLVGTIPWELTNLHSLLGLNLSYNHLSGPIPKTIGEMKSLESLDLSNNHLSGAIPKSMTLITTLEHLNLSYNNLHGRIPTGNQLQTLNDPSIYVGNPGLCGDPLLNNCEGGKPAKSPTHSKVYHDAEDGQDNLWFFVAMPIGFVVGFWSVIGFLLVSKRWRSVFLRLAEDIVDWILL